MASPVNRSRTVADVEQLRIRREGPAPGVRRSPSPRGGFRALALVGVSAVVLGMGLTYWIRSQTAPTSQPAPTRADSASDTSVGQPGQGGGRFTAAGYVVAHTKTIVGSRIVSRVRSLSVDEGDSVARGQILARLDAADLVAQLQQAEARLALVQARYDDLVAGAREQEVAAATAQRDEAQADLDQAAGTLNRGRQLIAEGVISRHEFEVAEHEHQKRLANVKAARERLDLLQVGPRAQTLAAAAAEIREQTAQVAFHRAQLELTVIRAPVTGIVTRRHVEVGELVGPTAAGGTDAAAIVTLVDPHDLRVEADVNEAAAADIRVADPVDISIGSLPGRAFHGRVVDISPEANRQKATVKVEVTLPDAEGVKPESAAKLHFQGPSHASPTNDGADASRGPRR